MDVAIEFRGVMMIRTTLKCGAASAAVALLCSAMSAACAQALKLSPELSFALVAPQPQIVEERCPSGAVWLWGCETSRKGRFSWNARHSHARPGGDGAQVTEPAAAPIAEGATSADFSLSTKPVTLWVDAPGVEGRGILALDNPGAPAETTLRLTSRDRLRNAFGGAEPQRFTDARSEAWGQRSKLTALSVELLFPFD